MISRSLPLQPGIASAEEMRAIVVPIDSAGFGPAAIAGNAAPRATTTTTAKRLIDQPGYPE
jgi:hypothetical protein